MLPNSLGPVIVISTISLGVFIVTEATLSYLGIGLPSTAVSWGIDIAAGQQLLREGQPILFYPAAALAITVLVFMMLGDVLRDELGFTGLVVTDALEMGGVKNAFAPGEVAVRALLAGADGIALIVDDGGRDAGQRLHGRAGFGGGHAG